MAWSPDEPLLRGLVDIIDKAFSNPTAENNQTMVDTINDLNQRADGALYLAEIFKATEGVSVDIRNSAGYLIKNRILIDRNEEKEFPPLNDEALTTIAALVIDRLSDSDSFIRAVSGSILSALLLTWPAEKFKAILSQIHANCAAGEQVSYVIRHSSWEAAVKIVEDVLDRCFDEMVSADETMNAFSQAMFETAIAYGTKAPENHSTDADAIALALKVANKIAGRSEYLEDTLLDRLAEPYLAVLGTCAQVTHDDIQLEVIRGMDSLLEYHPKVILTPPHSEAIAEYLVSVTSHHEYKVKFEVVTLWPKILQHSPDVVKQFIGGRLGPLCVALLKNLRYTEKDYYCMDPAQFAADNAAEADDHSQIAPKFAQQNFRGGGGEDVGGDSDEEIEGMCWGKDWTLRKGSAFSIDSLSNIYRDDVLPFVLDLLSEGLVSGDWETQESALLGIGALAPNCMTGLMPHLADITKSMLSLADHGIPLMRSITCWALQRIKFWLIQNLEYMDLVMAAICARCLDRNKQVQIAAISALGNMCQCVELEVMIEYMDSMAKVLSQCLDVYQEKSLIHLASAFHYFVVKCHLSISMDLESSQLCLKVTRMWLEMDPSRPVYSSFTEAIACMLHLVDTPFRQEVIIPVFKRACQLVYQMLQVIQTSPPGNSDVAISEPLHYTLEVITNVISNVKKQIVSTETLLETEPNFVPAILELCIDENVDINHSSVKSYAMSLIGDLSTLPGSLSKDDVHKILPQLLKGINCHIIKSSSGVILNYHMDRFCMAQNAIWALGELCLDREMVQTILPFLDPLTKELSIGIDVNSKNMREHSSNHYLHHLSLMINIITVLLRLAADIPREMAAIILGLPIDFTIALVTLASVKPQPYHEKSLRGILELVNASPEFAQVYVKNLIEMIAMIVTGRKMMPGDKLEPPRGPEVEPLMHQPMLEILMEITNSLLLNHRDHLKNVVSSQCTLDMQSLIGSILTPQQKQVLN